MDHIEHEEIETLYHYTSCASANNILSSKVLWMKKLCLMNDPKETQELLFNYRPNFLGPGCYPTITKEIVDKMHLLSNKIKNPCRQASFSTDVIQYNKNEPNRIDCKYKGDQHPRMWGTYGDSNKGVCLCFNKNRLLDSLKHIMNEKGIIYATKVRYFICDNQLDPEICPEILESELDNCLRLGDYWGTKKYLDKYWKNCLFMKHQDWRDEAEYKIIFRFNKHCEEIDHIDIPIENAIETIVLGSDFYNGKQEDVNKCLKYSNEYGINCRKIRWVNGIPSYEYDYLTR